MGGGQISLGPEVLRLVKSVSENGKQEKPLCVCVCVCVCVFVCEREREIRGRESIEEVYTMVFILRGEFEIGLV